MEENKRVVTKERPSVIVWFIVGIVVGAGALFAWNYYMVEKSPVKVASQMEQAQAQAQVKDLIARVSKLIILPTGEDPVVATINDAAALIKDQIFYKGAKNGDVVLVYQKASKAIVYSPDRNVIVNVGPIFLQNQQAQTQVSAPTTDVSTSSVPKKK
jgi:predicted negative regulator of RcsB-dependent stress response